MSRPDDILVVAQVIIHSVVDRAIEDGWETFCPDIGERDWEAVVEMLERLAPGPPADEWSAAYARLEARCKRWMARHPEAM